MSNQSLTKFKESLRNLPFKELEAKVGLYQECQNLSTRDQILLSCYENEIERRFLAWEVCEA